MRGGPVADEAIVLRVIKLGESSKIVSALTRGHGRVKLVAKGARQPGHRLRSLLEPGNELSIQCYPRPDRDLWMLGEASLSRAALTGAGSLDKLSHLFAALELADRLLEEREAMPELEAIYRSFLNRWHSALPPAMAPLFFALEIHMLEALGLGLDFERCSGCGRPLGAEARIQLKPEEGAVNCSGCAATGGRWLDAAFVEQWGAVTRCLTRDAIPDLAVAPRRQLGKLLHDHMVYHLPRYRIPRSLYWTADLNAMEEARHE